MPYFKYKARDQQGRAVSGTATAEGPEELETGLRDSGLYVVSTRRVAKPRRFSHRLPRKELIAFTAQLASIAGSGIPLLEGLEDIAAESDSMLLRETVNSIAGELRRGSRLSTALDLSPANFGALYINTVKAGEEMGALESVLEKLVSYLEWEEE